MSSPRRRNIVEARCDMDCRVYTFYPRASLKNATLKSDIYAILENDDVNISAGNNLTKFSNTRMKNTDYCSIDAERRRSIFLSNSTKITSFEIAENKMGKEQFSITRPSEKVFFGRHVCEKEISIVLIKSSHSITPYQFQIQILFKQQEFHFLKKRKVHSNLIIMLLETCYTFY